MLYFQAKNLILEGTLEYQELNARIHAMSEEGNLANLKQENRALWIRHCQQTTPGLIPRPPPPKPVVLSPDPVPCHSAVGMGKRNSQSISNRQIGKKKQNKIPLSHTKPTMKNDYCTALT
jgi:hypothetical protein